MKSSLDSRRTNKINDFLNFLDEETENVSRFWDNCIIKGYEYKDNKAISCFNSGEIRTIKKYINIIDRNKKYCSVTAKFKSEQGVYLLMLSKSVSKLCKKVNIFECLVRDDFNEEILIHMCDFELSALLARIDTYTIDKEL